jgi:hypothetical protein
MTGILGSIGVGLRAPDGGMRHPDHHDRLKDIEATLVAPDYPDLTVMRAGRGAAGGLSLFGRLGHEFMPEPPCLGFI